MESMASYPSHKKSLIGRAVEISSPGWLSSAKHVDGQGRSATVPLYVPFKKAGALFDGVLGDGRLTKAQYIQ